MILATVYVGTHMFELIVDNANMADMSTDGFRITPGLYSLTDGRKLDLISYDAAVYAPYEQPVEAPLPPEADLNAEYGPLYENVNYLGQTITFQGIRYFGKGGQIVAVVAAANGRAVEEIVSIEKAGELVEGALLNTCRNPVVLVPGPYLAVNDAAEYARDYLKTLEDAKPYVAENKTGRHFPGWGLYHKKG